MSKTLTRRQFLTAASTTAAALALSACGPTPTPTPVPTPKPAVTATPAPTPTPAGPSKGGTVTIAQYQEADKLSTNFSVLTVSHEVTMMINDGLLTFNEKGELVPFLAREVPTVANGGISADGLTYTIKLRNDVKWHDGQPFTAKDVVFTVNVINDPKNAASRTIPCESVTAPDDYTVVFKIKAPNAGFLAKFLFFSPLPEHALKGVADWKTAEYFTKPYPGTGAFKFVEWVKGSHIVLERNPNYYKGPVYLDKVVFRIIPNDDARLTTLKTGEADMSFYLIGDHVALAKAISGMKVYETPSYSFFRFIINLRDPILKDVRVRKALNHAVDKEGIVKGVIRGLGLPKYSVIPQASWAFAEPKNKYTYDVAKAKALLDEAGWKEPSPGATREAKGVAGVADGTKLILTVNNITGQPERLQVCQAVQQQWKAVGVQMEINAVDVAAYVANNNSFKFQISYGFNTVSPEPAEMGYWWQSKNAPNWHGIETAWPEMDDFMAKAAALNDINERKKMYAEYQEKMNDIATDILMYDRILFDAVKTKIQNYKPTAAGVSTWNAYEWWIKS